MKEEVHKQSNGSSERLEQVRIKKVGVLSVAVTCTVISFVVGLLIGLPMAFLSSLLSPLSTGAPVLGLFTGFKAVLIMPFMNAIFGFITGLIFALLYNLSALISKGIKLYA